ncbi:MAG: hypothetical protein HYW45_00790 [Candidatus Daviesbacteria bacterium]|nr:MAG: hypothetical protein HYW45_00790 [Candidatus Daviesbacteria bacterium]
MMILHINTKDQKVVEVSLKKDGEVMASLSQENEYGSQVLLPLIEKLLQTYTPGVQVQKQTRSANCANSNWKILTGIEVETGPGSFTGLRVGVSVANALGLSLGIPVNSKKIEDNLVY